MLVQRFLGCTVDEVLGGVWCNSVQAKDRFGPGQSCDGRFLDAESLEVAEMIDVSNAVACNRVFPLQPIDRVRFFRVFAIRVIGTLWHGR